MNYDILNENGEVINTIVAEQWFVDRYYPGLYREHIPPVLEEHPDEGGSPTPATLTPLQLRRLFTFEEKVALEEAIREGSSAVKVLMDDLAAAEFVDLSDPLVITGLNLLVQQNFLTQARADQILNNEEPDV